MIVVVVAVVLSEMSKGPCPEEAVVADVVLLRSLGGRCALRTNR